LRKIHICAFAVLKF